MSDFQSGEDKLPPADLQYVVWVRKASLPVHENHVK